MDRFQEMQVFVRIAERRSFTQAADDLQIPRATVTNLMKRLEERLGARLLERTTRSVRLTHDGEAHYRRCVRLIADLEEAEGSFRHAEPKGLLRVNLQGTLARHFIMPGLPAFIERHAQIELHIGEDDRLVDLVREGVDCVLRAGTLQDSSMIGRRVALLEQVTVASPAYLAREGVPDDLEALASHRAVNYLSSATGRVLPLEFTVGDRIESIELRATVSVTGVELYTQAALAGSVSFRCRAITSTTRLPMAACTACCPTCRRRPCRSPCSIRTTVSSRRACGFSRIGSPRSSPGTTDADNERQARQQRGQLPDEGKLASFSTRAERLKPLRPSASSAHAP